MVAVAIKMRIFVIIVCLLLNGCQKPDLFVSRIESGFEQGSQFISNESDYVYVFNKMETQIKSAPNRVRDKELVNYIENILCQISTDNCRQIRVYVIDRPEFNAHMLPNGAFVILTGLLLRIDDESQLAYVLAHEVGHYVYKHGIKKLNYGKLRNKQTAGLLQGFTNFMSLTQYSQGLEHEADLFSIEVLLDKQYDLHSVARLFKNLQKENRAAKKANRGGFGSSHPGTDQRISLIEENLVINTGTSSPGHGKWAQIKSIHVKMWLESELRKREFKSTLVLLNRFKNNSPDPNYFDYYIGELYRKKAGTGNTIKAVEHYRIHLSGNNLVNDVYKRMADVYVILNNNGAAKKFYTMYLNSNPVPVDYKLIAQRLKRLL